MCVLRTLSFVGVVGIAASGAVFACASANLDSAVEKPSAMKSPPSSQIRLSPQSDPLAVIHYELLKSGYPHDVAGLAAGRMLGLIEPDQVDIDWAEMQGDGPVIHPDSDPYAIVHRAFINSGYEPDAAAELMAEAFGLPVAMEAGVQRCFVSLVAITACDGLTVPKSWIRYINGLCVTGPDGPGSGGLDDCDPVLTDCADGENRWMHMTATNGCLDVPNGACVRIRITEPSWTVCPSTEILGCECFEELDPIDCEAIQENVLCCPPEYEWGDCESVCPQCD